MKTHALNCNNCGAQLTVPDTAHYAHCAHCGSQLAIHRNESALYTERIERLEQATSALAERMEALDKRDRKTDLQRQWDRDRATMKLRQAKGEDEGTVAVVGSFLVIGFFVLVVFSAFSWAAMIVSLIGGAAVGGILLLYYRKGSRQRRGQRMWPGSAPT